MKRLRDVKTGRKRRRADACCEGQENPRIYGFTPSLRRNAIIGHQFVKAD